MIRARQLRDAPGYTKRFAFGVDRCFRASTIRDVGTGLRPDWHTVKGLPDRQWDRIAAYSRPESRAALGFVEGPNKTLRVP
jgi:hypothetical protein